MGVLLSVSLGPRPTPLWSLVCAHNNTRKRKTCGEGLGPFITGMMSGGREVDVGGSGPTAKTTHRTIRSSALQHFWTPDLSVMDTTRIEQ